MQKKRPSTLKNYHSMFFNFLFSLYLPSCGLEELRSIHPRQLFYFRQRAVSTVP